MLVLRVGTDTATVNADAPAFSIDAAATGNFLEVHHQGVSEDDAIYSDPSFVGHRGEKKDLNADC